MKMLLPLYTFLMGLALGICIWLFAPEPKTKDDTDWAAILNDVLSDRSIDD